VDHTLRLIQRNWVVLAYNFNIVILVLIIEESCIGAFLLILLFSFVLVITLHCYFVPALAEYQPLVYSTLLFSPGTQTCCSEGEDGLEFFDEKFLAMCCPGCRSCGVLESSAILFH
jgi:hypothetical protein